MQYDSSGNLTNDGGQAFTYDVNNKMVSSSWGLQQSYDGDGQRVRKVENGQTTYYLRSSVLSGQVICEINGSGVWQKGYVYLGGQMLAMQQAGTVTYVHQDPVTKSQRMTNTSGTETGTRIELDPFGGDTSASANGNAQPYKYTSYERDGNGSDYAMARSRNTWFSRFYQPDPYDGSYNMADPQSFNRYSYVQNDPVNHTDSSGLDWDDDAFAKMDMAFDSMPTSRGFDGGGGGGGGGGYGIGFSFGGSFARSPEERQYEQRVQNGWWGNGFRTNSEVVSAQATLCLSGYGCWDAGSWVSVSGGSGRTFGWGVTVGGSASYGLVGGGFIDGNISVGQFRNGNQTTGGMTVTGGASAGLPSRSGEIGNSSAPAPLPNSYPAVVGRSAGVGAGLFFTNAGSVEQLRGPFYTQQLNTPLFSIRYDSDNSGTRVFSVTFGPTLGASYFRGTTNTATTPGLPTAPTGGVFIYTPHR